jgi:hypothetical protein
MVDGVEDSNRTSVPSLVGAYRNAQFLKLGSTKKYSTAIDSILEWQGNENLSAQDKEDLHRYLLELTGREFFLLRSIRQTAYAIDEEIDLIFSRPVWDNPDNLKQIQVFRQGNLVPIEIRVDGRKVLIQAVDNFQFGEEYELRIGAGFESWNEMELNEELSLSFITAAEPSFELRGEYQWTVQVPAFTPDGFNMDVVVPMAVRLQATPTLTGATVDMIFSDDLVYTRHAILNGSRLQFPDIPFSFGVSAADSTGINATLLDLDSDGIADTAIGKVTLSGPGIWLEDLLWTLEESLPVGDCVLGQSGDVTVDIEAADSGLNISWGETGALGLFVTTPGASIPLGPGQIVQNGEAFWTIGTANFPDGFYGPVTYGSVPENASDISVENGAPIGGRPLFQGDCYTVHVVTESFLIGRNTIRFESTIQNH